MKTNNMSKSAATKLARKNALMAKAAENAANVSKESIKTEAIDSSNNEDNSITSELAIAFAKALATIIALYPASTNKTKRTDFRSVLNLLLKLNVDIESPKDISQKAEKILNSIGFTTNFSSSIDKTLISKNDIPKLVNYLFEGYQKEHSNFCAIDSAILINCPDELEALSKEIWNPVLRYIVCQTLTSLDKESAEVLLSNDPESIANILKKIKCADQTRAILTRIAPYMGKIFLKLLDAKEAQEKLLTKDDKEVFTENIHVPAVNLPFSNLNPNGFPEEDSVTDSSSVEKCEEKKITVKPEKETTVEEDIMDSKRKHNFFILSQAIQVLTEYGTTLKELEKIGFSITNLLNNEKAMDTLKLVVSALQ